jgi:hypothetical protein
MSCTINLQTSVQWCLPQLRYQPVEIAGLEPVLSSGNMILQTILGPPFVWPFNRNDCQIVLKNDGTQDYQQGFGDFGYIEKAWVSWMTTDGNLDSKELTVRDSLGLEVAPGRPQFIARQKEDQTTGLITFRVSPAPDAAYTLNIVYQKKAYLMSSLASLWFPVPDEDSFIYNWGLLSVLALLVNDPRVTLYGQKFSSHLLGTQDGLSELQRNIFLGAWMEVIKYPERTQQRTQQAIAARGAG